MTSEAAFLAATSSFLTEDTWDRVCPRFVGAVTTAFPGATDEQLDTIFGHLGEAVDLAMAQFLTDAKTVACVVAYVKRQMAR